MKNVFVSGYEPFQGCVKMYFLHKILMLISFNGNNVNSIGKWERKDDQKKNPSFV